MSAEEDILFGTVQVIVCGGREDHIRLERLIVDRSIREGKMYICTWQVNENIKEINEIIFIFIV